MKAKQSEFLVYNQLPEVDLKPLEQYFHKKGSAFKEIKSNIKQLKNNDLIISNPYNPSSIDVLNAKVKASTINEGSYIINTEEYWLLCWYNSEEKKFVKRHRRIEKHKYLAKQDDNGMWKIEINASSKGVL